MGYARLFMPNTYYMSNAYGITEDNSIDWLILDARYFI